MLRRGRKIGGELRRQQRNLVLLAEQHKGFLANGEAGHLRLARAPEDRGDRQPRGQRQRAERDAAGEGAALFQQER